MKKLSIILAVIFTLGMFCSVGTYAEQDASEVVIYVGTGEGIKNGAGKTADSPCKTLNDALSRVSLSSRCNFVLVGDTTITDTIRISNPYVSITGKGNIFPRMKVNEEKSVFSIKNGSTFELGSETSDIVIDGTPDSKTIKLMPEGALIENDGTVILNDGFTFQNITTLHFSDRSLLRPYTSQSYPCVFNSGVFEMNGGAFYNCGKSTTIENSKTAVFNMNGGKISGANLTGVINKGEFNVNGGEISDIPVAFDNEGKLNVISGKVSAARDAITGNGSYTKSDAAIVEGKVENNSDNTDATATPEATALPEATASPEATAEPVVTPTPLPTLEPADENDTIPVYVNTDKVKFTDAYPFIDENNRTQLPVRAVANMLGCDVQWDGSKQLVTVTKDNTTIYLTIGSNELIVNGTTTIMDTEARVVNNSRTYIPARYIGEALGYTVDWTDGCVIIK